MVHKIVGQKEVTDLIYDTLMKNTMHPQFNPDKIENQEVDADIGRISFDYYGRKFDVWVE